MEYVIEKMCRCCEEVKPFDHFHRSKSKKYGINSRCKACISLRDKGLLPPHPSRLPLSEDIKKLIISSYLSGKGIHLISKDLNLSEYKIYNTLKDIGIVRSENKIKTDPKLDINYFKNIDNENKAYILGLMYSDGNLSPYNSKYGIVKSYKLRIRLQENDHDILKKISILICGRDITTIHTRHNKNWSNIASFQIGNMELGKDLIKLGCPPNKSNIISLPTFDQVPKELYIHFLRGFYDGDGGITKKAPIVMSFTSNRNMCIQLQKYFKDEYNILFKDYYERKNGYGSITISGRDNCYELYKLLYSDCQLYIDRKKNTIEFCLLDSKKCDLSAYTTNQANKIEENRKKNGLKLKELYPPVNQQLLF